MHRNPNIFNYFPGSLSDVAFRHLNEVDSQLYESRNSSYLIDQQSDSITDPRNGMRIMKVFPKGKNKRAWNFTDVENSVSSLEIKFTSDEGSAFASQCAKRVIEKKFFNQYLRAYTLTNFSSICKNSSILYFMYKNYIQQCLTRLKTFPEQYFSLQTALPFKKVLIGSNIPPKAEIVAETGRVPVYDQVIIEKTLRHFSFKPTFAEDIEESKVDYSNSFGHDVCIPEATLLLLLYGVEDSNVQCGVPVRIVRKLSDSEEYEEQKMLYFEKPIPTQSCNLDKDNFAHELMLTSLQKASNDILFDLKNRCLQDVNKEIYAVKLDKNYNLSQFDEYLQKINEKYPNNYKQPLNKIHTSWKLHTNESRNLTILTETCASFCCDKSYNNFINLSLKLEHKPQLGAEVMTKNELIREALRQIIIPNSVTERIRLNSKSFEPILYQKLSIFDIDNEYHRLYGNKFLDLLSVVHQFFNSLLNFPVGEYFLKFNSKYKEKILVFKQSYNQTETNTSLHNLSKNTTQQNLFKDLTFIPIDDSIAIPLCNEKKISKMIECMKENNNRVKRTQATVKKVEPKKKRKVRKKKSKQM